VHLRLSAPGLVDAALLTAQAAHFVDELLALKGLDTLEAQ